MKTLLITLSATFAIGSVALSAPAAAPSPGLETEAFSGKVVETTNAATYTYVCVDTGSKKLWAAAPQFDVKVGDKVDVTHGMAMEKYHSKTLKRDFDVVYFTGSIKVNGRLPGANLSAAQELPKGHPAIGPQSSDLPKGHPPFGAAAGKPVDFGNIKKAAGGKTVTEIVTGRSNLKDKSVAVRGKVVKYNPDVMGKNWLHIRDGSGSEGSNDLTITTKADAKLGDTVLVNGKVSTDRDFGGGYKYAVIIEDAKVTVE